MRQFQMKVPLVLSALLSLSSLGCTGSIAGEGERPAEGPPTQGEGAAPGTAPPRSGNDPSLPPSEGGGKPFVPGVMPPAVGAVVPGPMPLRRLSRVEYTNSIAELLHLDRGAVPALDLPLDPKGDHGFAQASPVGEVDASRLQDAADVVAALATKDLTKLLPCDLAKAEKACAKSFVEAFGRRAFRRALTASEVGDLLALYDDARTTLGLDAAGAIAQVVRGFLQAPQFLYRWELGGTPAKASGQVVKLTPNELASRLSFFLWSGMPDDALFAAADGGKLTTAEDVAREARRLLADPRSRSTLAEFHHQWLHLKDEPTTDLGRAMDAETVAFAQGVFEKGGGLLEKLLLSSSSYVNKALADVYGLKGVTGTALTEQKLDETQRFGVFTQAAFLVATGAGNQSHPPRRGKAIYEQLLCGQLPPLPSNVPPPAELKPTQSNRERFEAVAEQSCAKACHSVIQPLGFAFENYDGAGKYRTMDGGKPVNASGTIDLDGQSRSFMSARDLMPLLAASPTVSNCLATQWTRFALGRAELATEAAALAPAREAFARSKYDLRELVVAITQTPSFLTRTPSPMEVIAQ